MLVLNAVPCPYRCGTMPAMAMCTALFSPSQMASWWRCHRQGPAVESELWPPVSKLLPLHDLHHYMELPSGHCCRDCSSWCQTTHALSRHISGGPATCSMGPPYDVAVQS